MDRSTTYWAAETDLSKLGEALFEKIDRFYEFTGSSGIYDLWRRSSQYYQIGARCPAIVKTGQDDEYDAIFVNHYRNIIQHTVVKTTGTRPAYHARATNTDYRSRIEVRMAHGLLEYYLREEEMEPLHHVAAERAAYLGEGYMWTGWNRFGGAMAAPPQPKVDPETGETELDDNEQPIMGAPSYQGEIQATTPHPVDVIRDVDRDCWRGMPWIILRERKNRYDLAAMYPDLESDILAAEAHESESNDSARIRNIGDDHVESEESDDVCVYTFLHDPSPSVPLGRVTQFISEDVILEDGTYLDDPWKLSTLSEEGEIRQGSLHDRLHRVSGGEIDGTPFGYTSSFDLISIQEAINICESTFLTNISNFGVNNVVSENGATLVVQEISRGLNHVQVNGRDANIKVLELLKISGDMVSVRNDWVAAMETLSGVNSVARGQPEASLKSGAALALVQSQHIEFTRQFQASYAHLWECTGTGLVKLFQTHVPEARKAAIMGKGDRAYVQEISGADIQGIDRVVVELGSHLSQTAAGRLNLAQELLGAGFVETREQFLAVLETGRIEPVTHHQTAELDLIQAENEQIMDGEVPPVLMTDNHVLHIKEHHALGCNPEVRRTPQALEAALAHIQKHINQLLTIDPILGAITGQPNLQGAGAPPPEGGEAPDAAGAMAQPLPAENPVTGDQGSVNYPTNPATGEQWQPQGGVQ